MRVPEVVIVTFSLAWYKQQQHTGVVPQVGFKEGRAYADLIPTFKKANRLFLVETDLGKIKEKGNNKQTNMTTEAKIQN